VCGWRVKKNGGQDEQALGRSRGGFSTKIHIVVDSLGNPLKYILTEGQRHDVTQAEALLTNLEFERAIADKAYDADALLAFIAHKDAEIVIPPTAKRTEQRPYDKHLYKERHLVECFINKIKWFRRIFTRYDKLARRYLAFLHLAGVFIWLR
jgi:transposase